MRAFTIFKHDLDKLLSFYRATIYAYEQTDEILVFRKANRIRFDERTESGLLIRQPHFFKTKHGAQVTIRMTLREVIFTRVVSALEVFLIDLIRDAFLENKEPFKKQDIHPQFSQAELLSLRSPAQLFNKIINKECRKLSSGGFGEIVRFYKKYFDIDIGSLHPGLTTMEEYHDRRHILVHRMGKTDQLFRGKYDTLRHTVSIEEGYLVQCIEDLKSFSKMLHERLVYQLQHEFKRHKGEKEIDRLLRIVIQLYGNEKPNFLATNFEFYVDDELFVLNDILDEIKQYDNKKYELTISGKNRQLKSYMSHLKKSQRSQLISFEILQEVVRHPDAGKLQPKVLDDELLERIRASLPAQPWTTGTHRVISVELNIPPQLVQLAIKQLIARGIFKKQINGVLIENGA